MHLKVGELAKRSGVSVRTLHHYDQIGLLSPSLRTESGHRLYTDEDVERLQQVVSLRCLGFSLENIREFLTKPDSSPLKVLSLHLEKLQQEQVERQRLIASLEKVVGGLRKGQNPGIEELLKLVEEINMFEKYYTQEQLDQLQTRAAEFGEDQIREFEKEWATLIDDVRKHMQRGTDPHSEPVQAIARRWQELIELFAGGDPGVRQSLNTMYQQEGPEKASRGMMDESITEYIGKAMAKVNES